jgi:hypothetical protein
MQEKKKEKKKRKTYVLGLEELCDAEEELSGLGGAKGLSQGDKVEDLCEESTAFTGIDGRLVEDACLLQYSRLVEVVVIAYPAY